MATWRAPEPRMCIARISLGGRIEKQCIEARVRTLLIGPKRLVHLPGASDGEAENQRLFFCEKRFDETSEVVKVNAAVITLPIHARMGKPEAEVLAPAAARFRERSPLSAAQNLFGKLNRMANEPGYWREFEFAPAGKVTAKRCKCWLGWVCEDHPDKPWEHGKCGAAGER